MFLLQCRFFPYSELSLFTEVLCLLFAYFWLPGRSPVFASLTIMMRPNKGECPTRVGRQGQNSNYGMKIHAPVIEMYVIAAVIFHRIGAGLDDMDRDGKWQVDDVCLDCLDDALCCRTFMRSAAMITVIITHERTNDGDCSGLDDGIRRSDIKHVTATYFQFDFHVLYKVNDFWSSMEFILSKRNSENFSKQTNGDAN